MDKIKRKEKIEELFKEISKKPKDLDKNIMNLIYQEATSQKETIRETKPISWLWAYIFIGVLCVFAIVFTIIFFDFKEHSLIWCIAIAVFIPLIIEKRIQINKPLQEV